MSGAAARPGRHVFISCGEASGDRYGAALVRALHARDSSLRFTALGGPALLAAGAGLVQDSREVAVMGFAEVLGALPSVLRARRQVWRHLAAAGVDLCVPIDFPGFNLALAGRAHGLGLPVFYVVPPQLWAWGEGRLRRLRRDVDCLGTILPFEPEYYRRRNLRTVHLGHPLMDEYGDLDPRQEAAAREERLADPNRMLTVGLLPGSRRQEVGRLLAPMRVAARLLQARIAPRQLRTVLSVAPGMDPDGFVDQAAEGIVLSDEPLRMLLPQLDLALVCSGTAALEAALAAVPHEIVYATSPLSWIVARRLVKVRRVGLANLILEHDLVREHLQGAVAPVPLASALAEWVDRPALRQEFYDGVVELRRLLGPPGAWDRAAEAALALLADAGRG